MDIPVKELTNEDFWEFVQLYPDKNFELIHGVLVEMPSPDGVHGLVVAQILFLLKLYLSQLPVKIGYAVGDANDFILAPGMILKPDVSFIAKTTMPTIRKKFDFAPDLAVEVASPSNAPTDLAKKAAMFILHGTKLVWVVYHEEREVYVYRPESDGSINLRTYTAAETLDGGVVLPNFSLPVKDIFSDLEAD